MRSGGKALAALLGAIVLAVLFVALRDDDGDEQPAATAQPEATTETAPPIATEPPAPTATELPPTTVDSPPPGPTPVAIRVEDGRPVGGITRITVRQGERVALIVRSDVPEVVHLHGYDIERPVAPGKPAQLRFVAEITGRFEIELEQSGVEIGDLSVTP